MKWWNWWQCTAGIAVANLSCSICNAQKGSSPWWVLINAFIAGMLVRIALDEYRRQR